MADDIDAEDDGQNGGLNDKLKSNLKASLLFDITKMLEEVCKAEGLAFTTALQVSLTEVVWEYCTRLGEDLEAFASAKNKKIIKPEDVLLAVRRNDRAKARLQPIIDDIKEASELKKSTKKKRKEASEAAADDLTAEAPPPKKPKQKFTHAPPPASTSTKESRISGVPPQEDDDDFL